MENLNFSDGKKTFLVNGKCEITFNPTDAAFAGKLYDVFETLEHKQKARKSLADTNATGREIFDQMRQIDKEMRDAIDGVFEAQVCDAVFGEMNLYAYGDGMPVWANFLLTIIDQFDEGIKREKALSNEKIAKYVKKYHR